MPLAKADFIFGYAIAFCTLAFIQALISSGVMLGLLGVTVSGGALSTVVFAVLSAFLGTAMGLFTSAFARTEFQAVQFLPAFIFPQLLVCGLLVDRSAMAQLLQWFANVMPLTYSVDGMKQVVLHTSWTTTQTRDVIVVAGFALAFLILGAATIRRQEAK